MLEAFLPDTGLETFGRGQNQFYANEEDFLFAIADAMKEEYQSIIDAGFILQIEPPRVVTQYDMMDPAPGVEEFRPAASLRIEAVNRAIGDLPPDRIRYHLCWGSWHGRHTTDFSIKDIIDLVLQIRAGAYCIEAANPRHEHEWRVWEDVKLPDGKVLIPGVVAHTTNTVEHPELVAWRISNFARVVGRENVMAGTDCGFATSAGSDRVHPDVVWKKLKSLRDGAALASQSLPW